MRLYCKESTRELEERMRAGSIWVMGLGMVIATAGLAAESKNPPASTTECVRPDVDQFLEKSYASLGYADSYFPGADALFLPIDVNGQKMQWMGISWGGPREGILVLLDFTC